MCYARLLMTFCGLRCVAGMPPSILQLQVFNAYRVQHNDFRGEPGRHSAKVQAQSLALETLRVAVPAMGTL